MSPSCGRHLSLTQGNVRLSPAPTYIGLIDTYYGAPKGTCEKKIIINLKCSPCPCRSSVKDTDEHHVETQRKMGTQVTQTRTFQYKRIQYVLLHDQEDDGEIDGKDTKTEGTKNTKKKIIKHEEDEEQKLKNKQTKKKNQDGKIIRKL